MKGSQKGWSEHGEEEGGTRRVPKTALMYLPCFAGQVAHLIPDLLPIRFDSRFRTVSDFLIQESTGQTAS
ncbi:MAG: hypothetical protein DRP71_16710 [Verrucomicrobia bacterium]|nr:MAG: hypothetical protein DRP71_16710 [Verrucomicrobiota bacterium]